MARAADQVYDELLVLRCATGDRAALAELIARWQPRLVGYATRLTGRREVAVDAVQETWLAMVREFPASTTWPASAGWPTASCLGAVPTGGAARVDAGG